MNYIISDFVFLHQFSLYLSSDVGSDVLCMTQNAAFDSFTSVLFKKIKRVSFENINRVKECTTLTKTNLLIFVGAMYTTRGRGGEN